MSLLQKIWNYGMGTMLSAAVAVTSNPILPAQQGISQIRQYQDATSFQYRSFDVTVTNSNGNRECYVTVNDPDPYHWATFFYDEFDLLPQNYDETPTISFTQPPNRHYTLNFTTESHQEFLEHQRFIDGDLRFPYDTLLLYCLDQKSLDEGLPSWGFHYPELKESLGPILERYLNREIQYITLNIGTGELKIADVTNEGMDTVSSGTLLQRIYEFHKQPPRISQEELDSLERGREKDFAQPELDDDYINTDAIEFNKRYDDES